MKHIILSSMLLPGAMMVSQAATLSFQEVPAAKEEAAKTGKPCVIVWYGSDWQPEVSSFCKTWEAVAAKHKDTFVFGQYDDKLGQPTDARKKILPIEHYNLPAVVLLSADGTFMAEYDGKQVTSKTDALMKKLGKLAEKAPKFKELTQLAEKEKGIPAAKAAGEALELLSVEHALRCGKLTSIINKQDPEDTLGYRALFGIQHLSMYDEINGLLKGGKDGKLNGKDRKFDDAERYVEKVLSAEKMQEKRYRHRRQQWLAGLAYVKRERINSSLPHPDPEKMEPVVKIYKQIVKLDPKSQLGKGAARFVHYWSPDTVTEIKDGFYTSGDQTLNFEKDWQVNVTKSVDGPGTYVFSVIPVDKGRLVTRNFRLYVNGKEVAQSNTAPDKDVKSVEFEVPELPKKAKVEVRLTAKCQDGWFGCQGHLEMKKK